MLHTMAALSSGLRCASGSGGSWPCPRASKSPGFTPSLFSSSEGEWPLSLSTRAVEEVMLNLGPWETEWWRLKWQGLEQAREELHDGLWAASDLHHSGSAGRPIAIRDSQSKSEYVP